MAHALKTAALFAMGFGFAGSLAKAEGEYHGYETPVFVVERVVDGAELRAYAPYLVAQVTVTGDRREALTSGFRLLAGYIFGGNASESKVAMTVPVAQETTGPALSQETSGDGTWTVTFSMPRAYTKDTLPKPNSSAVRFVEIPAQRRLVLTFSGRGTDAAIAEKETELAQIAATAGLEVVGAPIVEFYDDPMTLPWNRRNEVALRLTDS